MAKQHDDKPGNPAHKGDPVAPARANPSGAGSNQDPKPDLPAPPAQVIDSGPAFPVIEPPGRIGANIVGHHENRKDDWDPVEPGGPGGAPADQVVRRPGDPAPRYAKSYPEREYEVVDQPFYDGVQLHEVGARIRWAGPPSKSLHPLDDGPRESTTSAPVFADPMSGRGDARKNDDKTTPKGPKIVTQ